MRSGGGGCGWVCFVELGAPNANDEFFFLRLAQKGKGEVSTAGGCLPRPGV